MNEAVVNNCYCCGTSIVLFEVSLSTCALMSVSRGIYVLGEINVTDTNTFKRNRERILTKIFSKSRVT